METRSLTIKVASESWSERVDVDKASGSQMECMDMLRRVFGYSGGRISISSAMLASPLMVSALDG